jgi:DNA repair protein RecN (Recombination protein N)
VASCPDVRLALEVVLAADHEAVTLVFDEVDAGVGGKVAVEVGRRLARLSQHTQVIVVTHLAQVAAFRRSALRGGQGRRMAR